MKLQKKNEEIEARRCKRQLCRQWRLIFGSRWLLYNGNAPFGVKAVVLRLAVGEIAKLVGEDLRVTNLGIYIAMRVPVNPIIYTRIGNIVTQLHRKSPIDSASLELGRSA